MKTIYILEDYDAGELIFASEDEGLLEEIMCDMFFEFIQEEFNIRQPYYRKSDTELMGEIWEDMMEFFCDYMGIEEVEVI